jgi:hypothetical protein
MRWLLIPLVVLCLLISTQPAAALILTESEFTRDGATARLTTSPALPVVNATTTLEVETVNSLDEFPPYIVGVRNDLENFFQLPTKVGRVSTIFAAKHRFSEPGLYQLWSDLGGEVWVKHPVTIVGNGAATVRGNVSAVRQVRAGGYRVSLVASSTLMAGQVNNVGVVISASTTAATILTAIKDDLSQITQRVSKKGKFILTFPEPGNYKLFIEFRPDQAKLPAQEYLLATFWVRVVKAKAEVAAKVGWLQRILSIFSPSQ